MSISKEFIEQLFKCSTIQRWTDHIRPFDFTALGKHAHMMTIAWIIGRRAETKEKELWQIDWDYMIRGSLYELLRTSVLTDIKSPVLDEIRANKDKWKEVNQAVLEKLYEKIPNMPSLYKGEIENYYLDEHKEPARWNAFWILRAASALATAWEFQLIKHANPYLQDLAHTQENISNDIRDFQYIPAVLDIYENKNDLRHFTDLCGRLRFQLRWSQTPIVPPRPILDHELLVAYLAYACITDKTVQLYSAEMWKRYHAFFGSLFHDLPEVLTRDVISPVKKMGRIGQIIKDTEQQWFEKTIKPLLPKRLYFELRFFAIDEFEDKKWPVEEWPDYLQQLDINRKGSEHPGPVIESCDKFSAFMEAYYSISFGINSPNLNMAINPPKEESERRKNDRFYELYEYFKSQLSTEE